MGKSGRQLTDSDVEAKRDSYYALAYLLFDIFQDKRQRGEILITVSFTVTYRFSIHEPIISTAKQIPA